MTSVKIYPFDTKEIGGRTLAYAEIVLNDLLLIKGIRVLEGKGGGLFISYPSQRGRDGDFHDLLVPLDDNLKKRIRRAVIDAFKGYEKA